MDHKVSELCQFNSNPEKLGQAELGALRAARAAAAAGLLGG